MLRMPLLYGNRAPLRCYNEPKPPTSVVSRRRKRRAASVACASGYQRDNGSYPRALDALAPRYLPQVPIDRFSGKALMYRTEERGYFLYSVGVNGKDEGGRRYDDDPDGDDLVVRMPRMPRR